MKDALKVGTDNVVTRLGTSGGLSADDAVRITLPKSLRTAKKWLDKVGMADGLTDLKQKMNEAAFRENPAKRTTELLQKVFAR